MSAHAHRSLARRARLVAAASAALLIGTMVAGGTALASSGSQSRVQPAIKAPAQDIGYAVNKPLCPPVTKPHTVTCFAMRRVTVKKGTPGAYPYLKNAAVSFGPSGGYTPADLALFYGFNPSADRTNQTVGIVDWYNDAHVKSDLATFDKHYGFKKETASSFRVVNEHGKASPLPSSSLGRSSSDEISLDVDTVRSVCHDCRILLVEASGPTDAALEASEDTAVKMGATEISNSFGGPEKYRGSSNVPAAMAKAFDHPGIPITASTGDDGWYGWDIVNDDKDSSPGVAEFPSTSPYVVSVGGTRYDVTNETTGVGAQSVWNEDGSDDQTGLEYGPSGAGGGGCSQLYNAPAWQKNESGYSAAGCSGKRLAADVSELADPATGFDIYDSWVGSGGVNGWQTVGGTSLAAPIVAAMYALADGSGGTKYPAASIYENATLHPTDFTDITVGGNSFCGGDTTANCADYVYSGTGGETHNPNGLNIGLVDCSFPRDGSDATSPPVDSECNAEPGYDGPSGVGTPANGVGLFASTSPKVTVKAPAVLKLHHAATFTATATPRVSGKTITSITFDFGDGHSKTGTATSATHTYAEAGSYTVTVTATDSADQTSIAHVHVGVGLKATVKVFGKAKVKAHQKAKYDAKVTDHNTGGTIKKIHWSWGDHHSSNGTKVSHKWSKPGKYTLTVTVTDSTGVKTVKKYKITVKS
ncbi:MAG TPA: PKD domain-containing protein [Mycobacteriales bacterium]|nr:PKD domain-containing protein [Mycobacteriales bacterium]